jgi:Anthrone oxygenase
MKKLILFLSIICASGLTMVNIYNGVIDAQSWASDIPASIQTVGPVNEVLILLTIILFWKDGVSLRIYFATSFVMYTAIVILTVAYFLPRNSILFTSSIPDHLDQIRAASAQWSQMNWLRSLLGFGGVLFSFKGLDTYYQTKQVKPPATGPTLVRTFIRTDSVAL